MCVDQGEPQHWSGRGVSRMESCVELYTRCTPRYISTLEAGSDLAMACRVTDQNDMLCVHWYSAVWLLMSCSVEAGSAKLQHLSSGTTISVTEPNLQSGNAVAHVVNSLLPPAPAASMTEQAAAADPGGRYESAMTILRDPVQKLRAFATLVQQARLTDLLADAGNELTLFAPSDEVICQGDPQTDAQLSPGAVVHWLQLDTFTHVHASCTCHKDVIAPQQWVT